MSELRIGVNPVIWTNDDLPCLGGHISVDRCLSEARAAGYAGIELGHKLPRDAALLRALLEAHDLELIGGWYGGRLLDRSVEEELVAAGPQLELLAELGSGVLVYAEVTGGVQGDRKLGIEARRRLGESEWGPFGRRLTAFAERARARGVSLAYHQHMGTVVETAEELDALVEATGDVVGLTLDTGHIAFSGAEPAAVVARLGSRIRHVHLKDVRKSVLSAVAQGPASYLDAIVDGVFTVPGDGDLDFSLVLAALRDVHYGGWLVVEADQDPAIAEPALFARKGADHVRSAAAAVGLAVG